jgi:hypothetical protein
MSTDPFDDGFGQTEPDRTEPDERELDERELDRALADDDPLLQVHLQALLDPGGDLTERTASDVDRALRARDSVGAALELLGVGWWTARALLTEATRPADRDPERG